MRFLSLDQITFRLPVPIGAVVRFTSKVVRTTQPGDGPPSDGLQPEAKVHIVVKVEVEDVATGVSAVQYKCEYEYECECEWEWSECRGVLRSGCAFPRVWG